MNKIKGITIWEQNAEFFALGIAAVALIAFAAMQFIGESNTVEVSGHGTLSPGNVDQRLIDEATRLNQMLSPDADPPIATPEPEPVHPRFEVAMTSGVSPQSQLRTLHASIPLTPMDDRPQLGEPFVEPAVPQPTRVVSQQYFDTLEPEVLTEFEEVRSHVSNEPYDITWITAASAVDLDGVLESFRSNSHDRASIPSVWYGGQATIVDIRLERQERVDGEWTNDTMIDPLPGQFSLRSEFQGIDAPRRDALIRELRAQEAQRALAQPNFFPTRNSAFLPPDPLTDEGDDFEYDETDDVDDDEVRHRNQLRRLQSDRARVEGRLDAIGGPLEGDGGRDRDRDRSSPPAGGSGGGSGGGPGFGARGSGTTQTSGDQSGARNDAVRRRLTTRLRVLDERIEELRALLPDEETFDEAVAEFGDGPFIVWGHDLDIQHGRVYRYRAVVDVYNPLFARRLNLIDEQHHLADSFIISSPASEWSEPIQAKAPLHPFITRAYAPGQERGAVSSRQGAGHATAEVYRFHDGRWWSERFNVEPGQRIGSLRQEGEREIDYGTEWFVLDIVEDFDAEREGSGPGREGQAARVILQNMINGEVTEIRHPRRDRTSIERQRLQDEAAWADVS